MRISSVTIQNQGINAILDRQATMQKTELQLASGSRMLRASDDPAAAAVTIGLDQQVSMHEQFQKNAGQASSRLELEESALEGITNAMQRARELTIQANSGALSPQNRQSIADEIDNIVDAVLGFANTKDGNGDYLFSGARGSTPPVVKTVTPAGTIAYVYQGDQTRRDIQIGPTRTVADADTGFDAFMAIVDATGAQKDIFSTLSGLSTALRANAMPDGTHIGNIDLGMQNLLDTRASVGARLRAVDEEKEKNTAILNQMATLRSDLNDLDYADAISRFNLERVGLEAAQKAYNKVQGLSLFNYI